MIAGWWLTEEKEIGDVYYINFYAITNLLVTIMVSGTDVSYIYIFMQSPTRNPYDIVTEGIISTIPVKFRLDLTFLRRKIW